MASQSDPRPQRAGGEESSTTAPSAGDFKRLLTTEARFAPSPEVLARVAVKDYQALYDEASSNLEAFWDRIAQQFTWVKPWTRVLEGRAPETRWFVGGQLNITTNCLDRHASGSQAQKMALLWVGEDGIERTYSFEELLALTCQIANGLRSLGVKKGDRVIIYLPLTPEGVATMLACARLGAIHSVVYAGLGTAALRARLEDAQAHVVVTADVGYRRGKTIALKAIVDEALSRLDFVEKVVVYRRATPAIPLDPRREMDFYDLCGRQPTTCPAEIMESEDPLYSSIPQGRQASPRGVCMCMAAIWSVLLIICS